MNDTCEVTVKYKRTIRKTYCRKMLNVFLHDSIDVTKIHFLSFNLLKIITDKSESLNVTFAFTLMNPPDNYSVFEMSYNYN